MSLGSRIVDATGKRYGAKVTSDNALLVTTSPYPEVIENAPENIVPFRQYFTTDGTASGTSSMVIDGSSSYVDYYIPSYTNGDRYVTLISLAISDSSATPAKFGALAALTNGVQIFYTSSNSGDIYIHDAIKTNFDAIRLSLGVPPIGSSNDGFRLSNVIGNADTYMSVVDLARFLPPYGVRLGYNSSQKLIIRIRDNLTALTEFDAIAFGFNRLASNGV